MSYVAAEAVLNVITHTEIKTSSSGSELPTKINASFAELTASGATTLNSTLDVTGATTLNSTLSVSGATTLSSDLTIAGNLTVNGTTTTVSSTNTVISDNLLE